MFLKTTRPLWPFMYIFFASIRAFSLPEPHATTLPLPAHIDDGDQLMVHAVSLLQVYRHHSDKDHYYYVPPIILSQQKWGAFSLHPHRAMIKLFAELLSIIKMRKNYDSDELGRLQRELAISTRELKKAHEKLLEPEVSKSEKATSFWRKVLMSEEKEQLSAQKKYLQAKRMIDQSLPLLSETISDSFNQKAQALLVRAGFRIGPAPPENADAVFAEIEQKAQELASSYGGYMSFSTIAGLSEWHLEQLRHYKAKYMPHLRITLLPMEKLAFFPLASMYSDLVLGAQKIQMLKSEAVMPDYLGGTLFFTMTVLGASGWELRLGPHLIPLGLRISFQEKREPSAHTKPGDKALDALSQTESIPASFCLSYQEKLQNYDRCSNDQHKSNQVMAQAIDEIARSPLCQGVSDPFLCGSLRSKAGQEFLK